MMPCQLPLNLEHDVACSMKEIAKKKAIKSPQAKFGITEGIASMVKEVSPAVNYYHQQLYEENSTKRKYSYVWENLDEESLTNLCLGRNKDGSKSAENLPEVILVVDEEFESKAKCRWKKATTLMNHVSTM